MNKIIIIFIIILSGCKSINNNIEVSQIDTNYPIILEFSKEYNKFSRMKIPLKLKIYNDSYKEYSFASIHYDYNSKYGGIIEYIYKEESDELKKVQNNKRKYIKSKKTKEYIIYTSHRLDSSNEFQNKLKPYIQLVQNKKIDTLNIGTVDHFKINNNDLFQLLTEKDSIFINTWNDKDITIPVKW